MNRMFKEATSFNGAIANWDVECSTYGRDVLWSYFIQPRPLRLVCTCFPVQPTYQLCIECYSVLTCITQDGDCPQDFDNVTSLATGAFVNANGCVDCSALNIGDYFELNDTLLVVDRGMLDSLILLHDDLNKVCVSNITDMKDALRGHVGSTHRLLGCE